MNSKTEQVMPCEGSDLVAIFAKGAEALHRTGPGVLRVEAIPGDQASKGSCIEMIASLDSSGKVPLVQLDASGIGGLPVATILPYAGATAPPQGFCCVTATEVSRVTYDALFSVVGTNYGAGDGSTTFNLPDLRGRTVVGKDNMGGFAANRITATGTGNGGISGATQSHILTVPQMPAHDHDYDDPGHSHEFQGGVTRYDRDRIERFIPDLTRVADRIDNVSTTAVETGITITREGDD